MYVRVEYGPVLNATVFIKIIFLNQIIKFH